VTEHACRAIQFAFLEQTATGHSIWTNQTNQDHCISRQKKCSLPVTNTCPCGKRQMMSHIVNRCPQSKLEGAAVIVSSADDVATEWLKTYGSKLHSTTTTAAAIRQNLRCVHLNELKMLLGHEVTWVCWC